MIKTRVIEVIPSSDGSPPHEVEMGFTMLPETLMEKKVPTPGPDGRMPPPVMVTVNGDRYFVIGYSWTIVTGDESSIPNSEHVMIVQRVPEMGKTGLIRANAGALDQIKQAIPVPGTKQ